MLSTLHLVYPPVSSYEADGVKDDPKVEALLRTSDFYVLAMRSEVYFDVENIEMNGDVWTVPVLGETTDGQPIADHVTLDIEALATATLGHMPEAFTADIGPKFLRFWPGELAAVEDDGVEPFEWFTTERLLHDKGRGVAGIAGLEQHRDFATYELAGSFNQPCERAANRCGSPPPDDHSAACPVGAQSRPTGVRPRSARPPAPAGGATTRGSLCNFPTTRARHQYTHAGSEGCPRIRHVCSGREPSRHADTAFGSERRRNASAARAAPGATADARTCTGWDLVAAAAPTTGCPSAGSSEYRRLRLRLSTLLSAT
ncbi:MAG: hypothetical protein JWM31_60 [Solirubrobacterales bacterium]|nr:hypothetical protein [Solirubrobacterales bacterium]